jgi:BASS family bile acid:Na+ symporter
MNILAWLGRQGPRAVAALVFIGVAVPPLGALLRPFVTEAIFLLLTIAFSRIDAHALRRHLQHPLMVIAATVWTSAAVPLLFGAILRGFGINDASPGLFVAIMLQGLTSPMMAVPAFAAILGLDATFALVILVASTALVPLTAPLFAAVFLQHALTISPAALGGKLATILLGSLLLAAVVRRVVGNAVIERHAEMINGINVLLLFVFVAAVMGDVGSQVLAHPLQVVGIGFVAIAVFLALLLVTVLAFYRAGWTRAWSIGLLASQRNLGLMIAATEGIMPGSAWLYFALSQFPIYLSPLLMRSIVRSRSRSPGSPPARG